MRQLLPTETIRLPPLHVVEPPVRSRPPAQLTSFVGRTTELAEVGHLVCHHRLVTLTGVGGIGKTRLAVQVVSQLAGRFGIDTWWVDLAPLTDPGLVVVTTARALGRGDQPGRSMLATLTQFIAEHRMLIVLDNCEHLLDGCAALAAELLGACPELTILATSREPLGVAGEVIWRTPPLSVSDDAVELLAQRARLARPEFALTPDNTGTVAEICRRLDGVPLAIELAAARVRALSLDEIADGLQDRFRLLTGGARTAVARQQTLQASVDWSYALLSEPERVLLRRLAVFRGGFDLDAARAVAGDAAAPHHQILDELTLLVDKSLVVADATGTAMRYRLLETVRQYAREKLAESGEATRVCTRHRDYYLDLAAGFDIPGCHDRPQRTKAALTEINNLRAAITWSRETGDVDPALRLVSSLQPLWLQGRVLEGLAWFDAVLTLSLIHI